MNVPFHPTACDPDAPLDPKVRQVLLGAIMGDGCLSRSNTQHPRFALNHGLPQEAYCTWKAEVLRQYVRTPPRIKRNDGYGEFNVSFATLTTRAFSKET